ncbi:MAG TPA: BamA/TamA family outer membrane protein [Fimbriimonadaceae bacterium]|nr:BamA/TamA family outer membrane protein [Fimbriimonadaceae bacterium]
MTIRIGTVALLWMLIACCFGQQTGLIRKIEVQGNKGVTTAAILNTMRTKVGQPYLQSNLDLDKKAISDMGFFQSVDVRAQAVENDNWDVVVNVLEWPVVKEIRIVGNTVIKTDELRKLVTVEVGKVFNLRDQVNSSRAIEALYAKRNYFARVEEFGPLHESPNTINIQIRELTINSVSVQGNSRTKLGVIAKLIKSRAGQAYDKHKWEMDLRRIYGTQWFENVRSLETQPPDDPFKVNLVADVKETRTGQFNIGLQMDPRSSVAGVIKLQDSNFRGTGQSLSVDFLQATTGGGPSVGIDYGNPFVDRSGTSIHASIYSRLIYRFSGNAFGGNSVPTNDTSYTERRTGLSLGFSHPLNDITFWGLNGRFERIVTNDLTTTSTDGFIKQDGDVGVLSLGFTRDRRDTSIDTSRGDYLRFAIEPGFSNITTIGGSVLDTSILGQHPFLKYSGEYRKYFTNQPPRQINQLDAPRRVLAFRLFYGGISGKVPFFEQYFAGGSETIRGYDEDRFWGTKTLVSNLELRIPVQKAFSVIGFVDYGGAWGGYGSVNNFTQSDKLNLHLGYGIGFSFRTPLGPLRLDLGFDERGRSRTHFLIGTSF